MNQSFTHTNTFNPRNNHRKEALPSSLFYRWRNYSTEKLSELLKVTQLISGRARTKAQGRSSRTHVSNQCVNSLGAGTTMQPSEPGGKTRVMARGRVKFVGATV